MNTVDPTLDLSEIVLSGGLTVTSSNSEGTIFTVDDVATVFVDPDHLRILGGDGLDAIFAPTLTFTEQHSPRSSRKARSRRSPTPAGPTSSIRDRGPVRAGDLAPGVVLAERGDPIGEGRLEEADVGAVREAAKALLAPLAGHLDRGGEKAGGLAVTLGGGDQPLHRRWKSGRSNWPVMPMELVRS